MNIPLNTFLSNQSSYFLQNLHSSPVFLIEIRSVLPAYAVSGSGMAAFSGAALLPSFPSSWLAGQVRETYSIPSYRFNQAGQPAMKDQRKGPCPLPIRHDTLRMIALKQPSSQLEEQHLPRPLLQPHSSPFSRVISFLSVRIPSLNCLL